MKTGTYCGTDLQLQGKTAILRDGEGVYANTHYLAQFDDRFLEQAFGWWNYRKEEFTDVHEDKGDAE